MSEQEYVVVPLSELVENPSFFSTGKTKVGEIAASLTEGLNRKSSEGWELVTIYAALGCGFAVFRKKTPE